MKTIPAVLILLALGLLHGSLQAQVTASVPTLLSYQGKVTDSGGNGLGAANPINRKVIFRIFDAAVGGTRLWTEEQTTTFANGEFSLLLGNGTDATGTAAGESRPAFDTVFSSITSTSGDRYLQITVDNGDNTITAADQPISPRQRLTSTAFSFRARSAETIPTGTDLTMNASPNYGLGWYGTGRLFNGTAIDGPVLFGLTGGALGTKNGATHTTALRWNSTGATFPGTTIFTGVATFNGGVSGSGAGLTGLSAANINGTISLGNVPALPASQITSGTFSGTLIPSLDASKITSGTFSASQIPSLDSSKISSGTFDGSRISGTLSTNQIPSLDATKIASGTLADARLSSNVARLNQAQTFSGVQTIPEIFMGNVEGLSKLKIYGGSASDTLNAYTLGVDANGGGRLAFTIPSNSRRFSFLVGSTEHMSVKASSSDGFVLGALLVDVVTVKNNGRVGINNASPEVPLHVNGNGATGILKSYRSILAEDPSGADGSYGTDGISILAEKGILAGGAILANSDARIKTHLHLSDGKEDLRRLQQIEVTDYSRKDTVKYGKTHEKKVIAQQVEKVFPLAVTKTRGVVPDIYQEASIQGGWVNLKTDLKKGERVRLIGEKGEEVYEVLAIDEKEHTKFRVAFQGADDKVFVYGREVMDFRSVDYDAIAMLNVSATQQLKKDQDAEVKALHAENAALRQRISDLEAAEKARDAKLVVIEKLLLSAGQPAARTASLKKAEGAE